MSVQKSSQALPFAIGLVVGFPLGAGLSVGGIILLGNVVQAAHVAQIGIWFWLLLMGIGAALGLWGLIRLRRGLDFVNGLLIAGGAGFLGLSMLCGWVVGGGPQ